MIHKDTGWLKNNWKYYFIFWGGFKVRLINLAGCANLALLGAVGHRQRQTHNYSDLYNLHSEILAPWNFNMNSNFVPRIEEQPYIEMFFLPFSNITTYFRVVGKMQDQLFNVWLFSNPGDKVLILVENRGQICPIVFLLSRNFFPRLEKIKHWNVSSAFFQQPWCMWICWKIAGAAFECIVVLQSRGQNLNCY